MPRPYKHPKTGVYWYRQRVPADLITTARGKVVAIQIADRLARHLVGAEVKVSLGTKEPAEAKLRAAEVEAQLHAFWRGCRTGPRRLTNKEIQALAGVVYREVVVEHEDDPGLPDGWEMLAKLTRRPVSSGLRIGAPRAAAPPSTDVPPTLSFFDQVLARHALVVDDDSRARLIRAVNVAMGEAADRLAQNARGNYGVDETAGRFPPIEALERASPAPAQTEAAVTLTALLARWSGRMRRPDDRTIKSYTRVVDRLIAYLGHDDATRVTDEDIVGWHRALVTSRTVKHETFVKTYQAAIGTIYRYGMSVVGGKLVAFNPAAQLRLEGEKEVVNRDRDFTVDEAAKILRAALAAPVAASARTAVHTRHAMRWVPWIGAYTGARPGEICQLRRQDFVIVDGVRCVALLPDAGAIKTGHFRNVPIHPHLIEQGLWDFVHGQPEGPLFYSRGATKSDRPWEATTAMLSEWVRKTVKVTDTRISPNHAWRHWFKSRGADAGIEELYLDAICGHAAATAGRRYVHPKAPTLYREIAKLPTISVS